MLHELEYILHVLHDIDIQTEENIFKRNEILNEIKEIDDYPELLEYIHQNTMLLQNTNVSKISTILKTAMKSYQTFGCCINNIGLVRKKVAKLREFYTKHKIEKYNK